MPTLAFFSPVSPQRSGVAHHSDRLLRELTGEFETHCYVTCVPSDPAPGATYHPYNAFRGREDVALFEASNGPLHAYMYPALIEYGGVVSFHDATLHDMVMTYWDQRRRRGRLRGRGDRVQFWIDFLRTEGMAGVRNLIKYAGPSEDHPELSRFVTALYADEAHKRERFRWVTRVLAATRAAVTHSAWVTEQLEPIARGASFTHIPLGVDIPPPPPDVKDAKRKLSAHIPNIRDSSFVVVSYGFIQGHKRLDAALAAFKTFHVKHASSFYILCGPRDHNYDLNARVAELGIEDAVIIDDSFPPAERVREYIAAADVCVNLRTPGIGSSSYTLSEIMAVGRPAIVSDIEAFREFPDDTVFRVPVSDAEEKSLGEVFATCLADPAAATAKGSAARAYMERTSAWPVVGEQYRNILRRHAR